MKTFIVFLGLLSAVFGLVFSPNGAFFGQKVCFDGTAFNFCENAVTQDSGIAFVEGDAVFNSAANEFIVGFIEHVVGGGVALHDSIFVQRFDINGAAVGAKITVLDFFADQEGKAKPRMAFDSVNNRVLIAYEYITFDEPLPEIPSIRFSIVDLANGNVLVNNGILSKFDAGKTASLKVSVVFNPTDQVYAFTYFGDKSSAQGKSESVFHRISATGTDLGLVLFQKGGLDTINPSLALSSTNTYIIGAEVVDANGNSDLFAAVSTNVGVFDFNSAVAISNAANANETELNLQPFGTEIAAVFVSNGATASMGLKILNAATLVAAATQTVSDFNTYDQLILATNGNTELAVIYRGNGNLIQLTAFNAALTQLDTERIDVPNNAANYLPTSGFVAINPSNKDHFVIWSTSFFESAPPPLPPGFLTSTTGGTTGAANIIVASFFLVAALVIAVLF